MKKCIPRKHECQRFCELKERKKERKIESKKSKEFALGESV